MSDLAPTPPANARPAGEGAAEGRLVARPASDRPAARDLARPLSLGVMAILALIIAGLTAVILVACDGHLIYALDDPYITLSLARHIAHGEYGINTGEAASPSSSILYPLLLAAFAWASWQDWVPLIVNAGAALATGALFAGAFCRWGVITRLDQRVWGVVLVVALCLATNTVGLVLGGLEHSLHALTSVFVVLALARAFETDRAPTSLIVAIVLLPLWRFEGAALAGLAIAALAIVRQRRAAAIALFGIAACVGAYMAAMHALGLPLLPSSVLRKSAVATQAVNGSAGLIGAVARNAFANIDGEAIPVLLLILVVGAHPLLRAAGSRVTVGPHRHGPHRLTPAREWLFGGVVAGALAAQVVFGRWGGGFARYEAYALALGAAGGIVLWGPALGALFARRRPLINTVAVLTVLLIGQISLAATGLSPLSARGIYEMHYQMRRFVVDFYRRPVAAIDIGLLGYKNPYYVLDLWGLGSEAVREARSRGEFDTAWLDRLIAARHVGVAMVYDNFFAGQIPADWLRIGVLYAAHRPAGYDKLAFYATSRSAVPAALAALRAFSQTTGPGTRVTIFADAASPAAPGSKQP